jgi:hypothetical protein
MVVETREAVGRVFMLVHSPLSRMHRLEIVYSRCRLAAESDFASLQLKLRKSLMHRLGIVYSRCRLDAESDFAILQVQLRTYELEWGHLFAVGMPSWKDLLGCTVVVLQWGMGVNCHGLCNKKTNISKY